MGILEFVVMIVGFTGGASVVLMVGASAIKRVRAAGPDSGDASVRELRDEVESLRAEVERLRGEVERGVRPADLDEIQNRLDFTERVLAQARAREALPGPPPR